MSYLLETLGRGLLGRLLNAFEDRLPRTPGDTLADLEHWRRDASTSFDLAMRYGTACLRAERLADAKRAFEDALHLDGPSHLAAIGLACVYDELGQSGRALSYLGQARACDPHNPAIAFGEGLCCEQQDQLGRALAAYRGAIEACPELRNGYERLAAIAVRCGDFSEAEQCYARLAELEPGDLDIWLTLASLRLQQGSAEASVETFQRALLVEPESDDEALDAAAELEDAGQLQQAITTLEQLIGKYPAVTEFRVHLGDLYVKAGDDRGAVAQYRHALELHPSFLEATVKLGTQHLRRQRYDEAARAFNRATELNDRLLTAFVGLGVAQRVAGFPADSQATFDLAVSLAPNSTLLFSETNRLHLKSLCRREPDDPVPAEPPGESEDDGLLVEAIRRHRKMLLEHPCRAELHYRSGMLLRQIGDFEQAAQAFQEAIAINPAYTKALIKLGITWRELGRPEESFEAFWRALTLDPRQVALHYELGLLYAQYNRFELAVERFEASSSNVETASEFRHVLALALQNVGMVDRADATWHALCALSDDCASASGSDPRRSNRRVRPT